eukprot:CAMPEP_0172614110 /NCGR_PEP_ID=MMETSP1068-20121228/49206_1 /TAXON_ID=35684 /ORGANISM="Pseudopedinella elastica, Strain CCMP716" /LENGTH=151 /DNA_ID=CAMNT_0013418805 /DNA_START=170 /DNA_END=625 /DNA_ORIENTATION=-
MTPLKVQPRVNDCEMTPLEVPETKEGVQSSSSSTMMLATALVVSSAVLFPELAWASESAPWVGPARFVLDPLLIVGQFAMLLRVIISWYPDINISKMPYLLVAAPTEPILRATRSIVPPAFGVDISPVVWIAILSFFREILFGQQGLFKLL